MYFVLLAFYIIVCIFLISTILLQAGRGGGLTEAFGGAAESLLGTQASTVLKRATEVSAVLFLVLSLVLAVVTARRGRSLFLKTGTSAAPVQAPYERPVPAAPVPAETAPEPPPEPAPAE